MKNIGFLRDAPGFFSELADNNNRAWFDLERDRFSREVTIPFLELLNDLPEYQPFKVFRLHRDVRFSHDKSPYKLMHGAAHTRSGGAINYVHVDREGLLVAAGLYVMSPPQLAGYRDALLDDKNAAKFATIVGELSASGLELTHGGVTPLTAAPKGVSVDHPRIDWLRWKGCVTLHRVQIDERATPVAVRDEVESVWKRSRGLCEWLDSATA